MLDAPACRVQFQGSNTGHAGSHELAGVAAHHNQASLCREGGN